MNVWDFLCENQRKILLTPLLIDLWSGPDHQPPPFQANNYKYCYDVTQEPSLAAALALDQASLPAHDGEGTLLENWNKYQYLGMSLSFQLHNTLHYITQLLFNIHLFLIISDNSSSLITCLSVSVEPCRQRTIFKCNINKYFLFVYWKTL